MVSFSFKPKAAGRAYRDAAQETQARGRQGLSIPQMFSFLRSEPSRQPRSLSRPEMKAALEDLKGRFLAKDLGFEPCAGDDSAHNRNISPRTALAHYNEYRASEGGNALLPKGELWRGWSISREESVSLAVSPEIDREHREGSACMLHAHDLYEFVAAFLPDNARSARDLVVISALKGYHDPLLYQPHATTLSDLADPPRHALQLDRFRRGAWHMVHNLGVRTEGLAAYVDPRRKDGQRPAQPAIHGQFRGAHGD